MFSIIPSCVHSSTQFPSHIACDNQFLSSTYHYMLYLVDFLLETNFVIIMPAHCRQHLSPPAWQEVKLIISMVIRQRRGSCHLQSSSLLMEGFNSPTAPVAISMSSSSTPTKLLLVYHPTSLFTLVRFLLSVDQDWKMRCDVMANILQRAGHLIAKCSRMAMYMGFFMMRLGECHIQRLFGALCAPC